MVFISFPILSYLIRPQATTSIGYTTICKAKPIKFISKLYTDHNTLWVKHATHQKAESLRTASLSKLDNMVNNKSIFFSQPYLCIQPTLQSPPKNPFFYFSQFSPPYSAFTSSQNHSYNPH